MNRLAAMLERVDALGLRERLFLLAGSLLILYMLADAALLAPLAAKRGGMDVRATELDNELRALDAQARAIEARAGEDPDRATREEIARLRAELDRLNDEFRETSEQLIPAVRMAETLEAVLTRETPLRLVKLEGLPAEPVLLAAAGADGGQADGEQAGAEQAGGVQQAGVAAGRIYRHGLRIEFIGGYLDVFDYLRALESLPWGFFWDSVEFEVFDYPDARASITVYTLSLNEGWIGI